MSVNVSRQLLDFDFKTMFFNNTIKNKIIKGTNSLFTGINVRYGNILLNNICLVFTIINPTTENIQCENEKYKCFINDRANIDTLKNIERLEQTILDNYCLLRNKNFEIIHTLINNEYKYLYFKFYDNKKQIGGSDNSSIINRYCINNRNINNGNANKSFVVKISGVWENDDKIGISYKICSI